VGKASSPTRWLGFGAGAYRAHRSDRDLERSLSAARGFTVSIGAAYDASARGGGPNARRRLGPSRRHACASGPALHDAAADPAVTLCSGDA
jgi:hypothetical protein